MTTEIRFDYGTLDDDQATTTREHAERIRELVKMTSEAAVEIGRRLLDVRGRLDPSVFQAWLRAEFRWNVSTAWKYMASAEQFGHLDCLDRFDRSALYVLSKQNVPEAAREAAVELAGKGEHVTRDRAKAILREHDVAPSRRDAGRPRKHTGRPRKHTGRRDTSIASPNVEPVDAVRELRESLDAFAARLDEWHGQLGDDVRLELANTFTELAMKLRHDREAHRVARKRRRPAAVA